MSKQVSRLTLKRFTQPINGIQRNRTGRIAPQPCCRAWRQLRGNLQLIRGCYAAHLRQFLNARLNHTRSISPLTILRNAIFLLTIIIARDNMGMNGDNTMKNLLKATITIKGTRPMLWHRFGPDAIPLEKQERTGVAGNDPEEWKRTVMMNNNRQLYIDPTYIFGMLVAAAKYTRKGKGSIQSAVAATLQIVDERILIPERIVPEQPVNDPTLPVYLDIRSVRNPTTKARNVRYRIAASAGWTCSFTLQWDKTVVPRGQIEAVIYDAGTLVGLGNGRGIGFGRFEVVSFIIEDDAQEKTA